MMVRSRVFLGGGDKWRAVLGTLLFGCVVPQQEISCHLMCLPEYEDSWG